MWIIENLEHQAKTMGFRTIFSMSRGTIKDNFNGEMAYMH